MTAGGVRLRVAATSNNNVTRLQPTIDAKGRRPGRRCQQLFGSAAGRTTADNVLGADRRGPARKSRFTVQIDDVQVPGWQKVELPDAHQAEAEYRNGNEPEQNRSLWGRTEYEDLKMERGVEPASAGNAVVPGGGQPVGTKLFDWYKKARKGDVSDARKTISVEVYNEAGPQGTPVAKWVFEKAWPKRYSPPTLDARARGEIATEGLTLAYYKYDRNAP